MLDAILVAIAASLADKTAGSLYDFVKTFKKLPDRARTSLKLTAGSECEHHRRPAAIAP